jgi:rhodanese-related sulfurtransferase
MEEETYPIEVDVSSAAAKIQKGATILDVREPQELLFCKIEGSLDIPMGQISGQLSQLPNSGALLILCHHGMRSAQVTHFLRARGFENAINVRGGIEAWSKSVDPQIPRY